MTMKTFTYVAAIALLTASAAFAQSSSNNSSMTNNATPTPSMSGPAEGNGGSSSQPTNIQSGQNQAPSGMDQSSMNQSGGKSAKHIASKAKPKAAHVASRAKAGDRSQDSRENQMTMQLNRQQLAGGSMNASTGDMSGNPFNNGAPQQAQAGGANCTPDRPDCGTARQNPSIQSSPQQRTYNASPE
jgi:hypothetical protein